jgi:hypothetical protein
METSILIGIIGIIITIFGVFYVRKFKYPGKLSLIKILSVGLLNDLIKNFEDISIKYKGTSINDNIYLLKAIIFNDGKTDIDDQMIKKPLELELPENYKWIDIKLDDVSSNIKCDYKINDTNNSLLWNFDLICIGEFISFDALIEVPKSIKNSEQLIDKVKIKSRITNTAVKKRSFPNDRSFRWIAYMFGLLFLTPLIVVIMSVLQPFQFQRNKIYIGNTNGEVFEIFEYDNNNITLKNRETKEQIVLSIKDFETNEHYKPVVPKEVDLKVFVPMISIFFAFSVVGFIIINRERKRYILYTKNLKQKKYFTDLD